MNTQIISYYKVLSTVQLPFWNEGGMHMNSFCWDGEGIGGSLHRCCCLWICHKVLSYKITLLKFRLYYHNKFCFLIISFWIHCVYIQWDIIVCSSTDNQTGHKFSEASQLQAYKDVLMSEYYIFLGLSTIFSQLSHYLHFGYKDSTFCWLQ